MGAANDLFRLSLSEATRRMKRSEVFRHPLFAVGELHDPMEPEIPFNMRAPLPEIESEWSFRRDSVPDFIKLYVGRPARKRCLAKLEEEYNLPPVERFRRLKESVETHQYRVHDPETWDTPFFCVIRIPAELSDSAMPVFWCGNRSVALTDPRVRPWFFDVRSRILHGKEAVELARAVFQSKQEN
jgi:hypothetical protein